MYWMMTYLNNPHPLGDYLTQYQLLIVICAYVTAVWEITFLFTVWRPWLRVPVLVIAGIIEGFISPTPIHPAIKIGIGITTGIALYSYLLIAGRGGEAEGVKGEMG